MSVMSNGGFNWHPRKIETTQTQIDMTQAQIDTTPQHKHMGEGGSSYEACTK